MYPLLISVGPIAIRTASLFVFIACIAAGFIYWRRGREEHYQEDQLFDVFVVAILSGMIASRVGFVLVNFQEFGFQILDWINIIVRPGFDTHIGMLFASYIFYKKSGANKWDQFEILDFWATAVACGLIFINIGLFFDGSGSGFPTSMPWGVQFPNLFEPAHPAQLYLSLGYILLFWYLSRVEFRYRTFAWYRAGKKTAQTGFVFAVFLICSSLWELIMTFLRPTRFGIGGMILEQLVFVILILFGIGLLYFRSGRNIGLFQKKRQKKVKIEQFTEQLS